MDDAIKKSINMVFDLYNGMNERMDMINETVKGLQRLQGEINERLLKLQADTDKLKYENRANREKEELLINTGLPRLVSMIEKGLSDYKKPEHADANKTEKTADEERIETFEEAFKNLVKQLKKDGVDQTEARFGTI